MPTLDDLQNDSDFKQLAPRDQRVLVGRLLDSDSDYRQLNSHDQLVLKNRAQGKFPDATPSQASSSPGIAQRYAQQGPVTRVEPQPTSFQMHFNKTALSKPAGIYAAPPPSQSNAFMSGLEKIAAPLSMGANAVKAAIQPLDLAVRNASPGYESRYPSDIAEQNRVANLPFGQRMQTLQGQDLRTLGQPMQAQQNANAYQHLPALGKIVSSIGKFGVDLGTDPMTWLLGGTSGAADSMMSKLGDLYQTAKNPVLKQAAKNAVNVIAKYSPVVQKGVSAGFGTQMGVGALQGAKKAYETGDPGAAVTAALQAVMAGLSIAHVTGGTEVLSDYFKKQADRQANAPLQDMDAVNALRPPQPEAQPTPMQKPVSTGRPQMTPEALATASKMAPRGIPQVPAKNIQNNIPAQPEATAAAPVNMATPAVEPPVTPETPAVPNPAPTAEPLPPESQSAFDRIKANQAAKQTPAPVETSPQPPTPAVETTAVKQPWEMTRKEYVQANRSPNLHQKSMAELTHRSYVMKAVREGDAVPPEVLADYPDLNKTTTKPAEVAVAPVKPTGLPKPVKSNPTETVKQVAEKSNNNGFTKDQQSFLVKALDDAATNLPERSPAEIQYPHGKKTEGQPITIDVPGDGKFTVSYKDQANTLRAEIAKNPGKGFVRYPVQNNVNFDFIVKHFGGLDQAVIGLEKQIKAVDPEGTSKSSDEARSMLSALKSAQYAESPTGRYHTEVHNNFNGSDPSRVQYAREYSYYLDGHGEEPTPSSKIGPKVGADIRARIENTHKSYFPEKYQPSKIDTVEQSAQDRIAARKTEGKSSLGSTGGKAASDAIENIQDLAIIGAARIARGAVNFADWSKDFVSHVATHLGDAYADSIKPHLQAIYDAARSKHEENQENVQTTGLRPVSQDEPRSETNIVVPEQASTTAGKPVERSTETAPETKTGTPEANQPLTGAKNAITEEERMTRGMSEVNRQAYTGIKESADIGRKSVDAGEIDPQALAHSVAEKPRPLDAKEVGALAYDRARITNEHDDATRKLAAASDAKDENGIAQQQSRLNLLEEQFDKNDQALVKGGREQSAAFNARKMVLNSDYTTAGVVNRLKGANPDKPVTTVETKRITDLATALDAANKKIADYEAKQKSEPRTAQNKSAQGIPKFGEKNTVFTSDRADAARARLKEKMGRASAGFDPTALGDIVEIGGYYFEGGVRKFADWAGHMRSEVPGVDNETLRQAWAQVTNDQKLKGVKTRLTNQAAELKGRLASGNLETPKRIGIVYDKEAETLRDQRDAIRYQIDKQIALRQKMNVGDYITRWQRLNVLSGVSTLGKLTAAATGRIVVTPIEDAFGYVLRKTIPGLQKVADIAPGEGTTAGIRGNIEGLKSVFSKQTLIDMKQKVTTGMNSLDLRNQKPGKVEVYHPFMDFFGSVHGALKTPAQRDAFSRALNNYGETALRNGKDLRDPAVQMESGAYAYQESKRAILQSDNLATNLFQQFIGSANRQGVGGKTVATAAHILTPIVKVPTNYIAESANYIAGGPIGIAKLIAAKARGELKPEEADAVMRAFKKQGVGAGLLALGYFSPNGIQAGGYYGQGQKEKNGVKFGDVKVYGVQIPHLLLHSPAIEALQFGATWRRAMDQTRGKASTDRLGAAAYQSGMGLGEQVPFLDQPIRLGKATENAQGVGKKAGEIVSSIVVPQLIQQGARYLDKNSKGDTIKRHPRGFTDTMKQGIPLLRKQVPASKGSGVSYKSPKF